MDYSTEMFADDTCALLDALDIPKTHLFGVSVGGMVAQQFALKYPDRIDRLVLGCTMPGFTHIPPAPEDLEALQEAQILSPEEGVEKMMTLFLSQTFMKDEPGHTGRLKDVMMLEKEEQGMEALFMQLGAAREHDTVGLVKNITVPTLVISGTKDPIAPVENARFLAGQILGSTLAEIEGVRHAFWVEKYEEACGIINDFLKS